MRKRETKHIVIGVDPEISKSNYSTIAVSINGIREDERKTLLDKFSSRLDALACQALKEKMSYSEIYQLLSGEAELLLNQAAELHYV